jgi:Protein of unknown function (DUF3617)
MSRIHAMALFSVAALIGANAPAALAQERLRAGLWEMTTTKGGQVINTGTHCFTAEDARSANGDAKTLRDTLEASFAKASCKVKDLTVTGNTVSYVAECGSGADAHTLSAAASYRGDTVESQMTVKRATLTDTTTSKGHRVGACP